MLVAAAVCPCPPLLVPAVAAGAAPELDAARTACTDALGVLAAARPDRLIVVGPTRRGGTESYPEGAHGSFRGFGVDVGVRLGRTGATDGTEAAVPGTLPPSLAVAAWLLGRTGWSATPIEGLAVGESFAPERCRNIGREVAAGTERVALLVMGDASACRTLKAPGYLDERAEPFDAAVGRALGSADLAALEALDVELARRLMVSGRAPWQVLAGAAEDAGLGGALLYEDAPYGVGYVVASWS
ncbi:class III extradiol dioxygenase subunit B-like domain-containing protein [Streptomyces sp. NPDC086077]|uniref:class III extradiol dioxygenase subunit B-like domain-containing protein n=1 Tax=Streptomyces sp. NPDC086077 TaxID=3154862 RepID=UPI003432A689